MHDTDPKTEDIYRQMLMALPNETRFMMGIDMFETARTIVLSTFPPDLSDVEKRIRLAERFYGDEPELVKAFAAFLRKNADEDRS